MRLLVVLFTAMLVHAGSIAQHAAPHTSVIAQAEKRGARQQMMAGGNLSLASGNFTIDYYRFRWHIDPDVRAISGAVTGYFTITANAANQLVLDMDNSLIADSVLFRHNTISFLQNINKTITLNLAATLNIGDRDSITIYYKGVPADNGFGSFTQTTHGGVPIIWTLSEPYGARDWWPCRNGLDDKADSIDTYVTCPAAYFASANGVLADSATADGNTTFHYKHRYPIATYLVGIAVTNYSRFATQLQLQTAVMPVTTTVYPESLSYFQSNIRNVYNALQLYDQYFGPYPFLKEQYGQTQFSWGGGMEHQTNSFVTNADEYLMAHELGHQWFGDKITCASWQDIWLNEGFATYLADMFYTEHFHPDHLPAVVAEDLSNVLRSPNGSVLVDDTTSVDRIFDNNLSYKKGAFMLRMLRKTLGDSFFFEGLRQYQQDPALVYGFAHTADLQRNLEKVSGMDLAYFFNQWFYGRGFPSVNVEWTYNNNQVQALISQNTSDSSVLFYKLPLDLTFKNAAQQQTITVDFSKNKQLITLPASFVPDTVLIDPVQYLVTYNNTSQQVDHLPVTDSGEAITITIYPNPVNNILYFKTSAAIQSLFVQVCNAGGARVMQQTLTANGDAFILPVAILPAGVYYVGIKAGNRKPVRGKFIKL